MAIIWPFELNAMPNDDFSIGFGDPRKFSDPDSGIPLVRPRYSSVAVPHQLSLLVKAQGFAVFQKFWYEDTNYGTKPFQMPVPYYHGISLSDEDDYLLYDDYDNVVLTIEDYWTCIFGRNPPASGPAQNPYKRINFEILELP